MDNDSGPGDEIGTPGWALFSAEPHVELRRASLCGLVPPPSAFGRPLQEAGGDVDSDYQSLGLPESRSPPLAVGVSVPQLLRRGAGDDGVPAPKNPVNLVNA